MKTHRYQYSALFGAMNMLAKLQLRRINAKAYRNESGIFIVETINKNKGNHLLNASSGKDTYRDMCGGL